MKKIVFSPAAISGMGHMDTLVIADAGLPIPAETERIDLALAEGIPAFLDTLRVVLQEMEVETAVVAEEILSASPHIYEAIQELLGDAPIETITPGLHFTENSGKLFLTI